MNATAPASRTRSVISLLIFGFLGLQVIAVVNPFLSLYHESSEFLWPFVDYPMYSRAYDKDDPVTRYVLYGCVLDGSPVELTPKELGLGFWKFFRGPVHGVLSEHPNVEVLRRYARIYEQRHGVQLVGFRLENHPIVLSEHGPAVGTPSVLREIRWTEPSSSEAQ